MVQIGAGPWLHVPVGKLREDRYLPLHPHLVALTGQYRAAHAGPANPLLLPRENGKPACWHAVTRCINKAGAAAGPSRAGLEGAGRGRGARSRKRQIAVVQGPKRRVEASVAAVDHAPARVLRDPARCRSAELTLASDLSP